MIKKIIISIVSIIILVVIALYITTRPTVTENGAFIPSPLALKLSTSPTTDYDNAIYKNPYIGNKKVLMVCTETRNMTMANGKQFSTGNHPVEMLLPILHLQKAGFQVDVVTPTGQAVKIEMWAMPEEDNHITTIFSAYKNKFENPLSLSNIVNDSIQNNNDYLAVFIPGGHGAMLGLPDNKDLNKVIHWAKEKEMFMLAICHGPAALLAASKNDDKESFIYNGYKIASFPDAVDAIGPLIGYTPGKMPWIYGEKLNNLGVTIINEQADNTVYIDRKLITGASPLAANDFGKLAATELLKVVNK